MNGEHIVLNNEFIDMYIDKLGALLDNHFTEQLHICTKASAERRRNQNLERQGSSKENNMKQLRL